jgi:phytoene synthase
MDPHAYCREKAAASGSSFYYSFRLLPADKRDAITAFYAFCREVDDVVDECQDTQVARIKLAWWRKELGALYTGHPEHPVTRALAPVIAAGRIPEAWLQEIIDGMETDLDQDRFADAAELALYCHRVAGVVGQVSAEIFGYRNPATRDYAHELGLAFQLTNIIRDVGEDALRGRIYLPQDALRAHGLSSTDLLRRTYSPQFVALMESQYQRARQHYDNAWRSLPREDRRSQRAGLAMMAIYETLLEEIRRDGFHVLDQRISLTPLRKLWLASKASLLAR